MLIRLAIKVFFLISLPMSIAYCCTTVFSNNNGIAPVVARSTDLYISDSPKLVIYPKNLDHNGESGANPLKWKSKYGSLVVTEFNSNAASDGINEEGLAAHLLYLSKTQYPESNKEKPSISNLLWAQYVLDNFKTVKEALAHIENLQVVATELHGKIWPLHLALEDQSGDSAIIEYINGKIKIYHSPDYQIMTNEPAYDIQLSNLKKYRSFGGQLPIPGDPDPLSRFVRASFYLKTLPKAANNTEAIANVFSVIRSVMVPFGAVDTSGNETEDAWATRWISIADLKNKVYYFNSTITPNLIWLDLNKFDFSAGAKTLTIDPLDVNLAGDISQKILSKSK